MCSSSDERRTGPKLAPLLIAGWHVRWALAFSLGLVEPSAVVRDAVAWRRHLHQYPELSFHEHETARFVRETLASFGGLEIQTPTPTSVVARLRGARPGPTLALRADLDALAIQEASGEEFASEREGVMHACGHDGHTAMLLATARLLTERRSEMAGEVRFVFQHAEELPPGGGAELVAAGVADGVDAVVGCHLLSTLELGRVGVLDGCCTAAADTFAVKIRGRGGHAAFPHETVDPVLTAAVAITSLQQIVSRNSPPLESVVVSVTRIAGGTADNVIPNEVELRGTVRTFKPHVRERTVAAMTRIFDGVTAAHGASNEFECMTGYDPVINEPALAALVREAAGAERIIDMEPLMAGDDFSAYLRVAPGCFFFVGAGESSAFPHHHPQFKIDERALPIGIETLTETALRFLAQSSA
jgi:amidohydrolase